MHVFHWGPLTWEQSEGQGPSQTDGEPVPSVSRVWPSLRLLVAWSHGMAQWRARWNVSGGSLLEEGGGQHLLTVSFHREFTETFPSLLMQALHIQALSRPSPHPLPLCMCPSALVGSWTELARKWSRHSHWLRGQLRLREYEAVFERCPMHSESTSWNKCSSKALWETSF